MEIIWRQLFARKVPKKIVSHWIIELWTWVFNDCAVLSAPLDFSTDVSHRSGLLLLSSIPRRLGDLFIWKTIEVQCHALRVNNLCRGRYRLLSTCIMNVIALLINRIYRILQYNAYFLMKFFLINQQRPARQSMLV